MTPFLLVLVAVAAVVFLIERDQLRHRRRKTSLLRDLKLIDRRSATVHGRIVKITDEAGRTIYFGSDEPPVP